MHAVREALADYVTRAFAHGIAGVKATLLPTMSGVGCDLSTWSKPEHPDVPVRHDVLRYFADLSPRPWCCSRYFNATVQELVSVAMWAGNLLRMLQRASDFLAGLTQENVGFELRSQVSPSVCILPSR